MAETSFKAAIGIGSNLGDAKKNVARAIEELKKLGNVAAQSRLYKTKPWGVEDQPDFVNAAVLLETGLEPHRLLRSLKDLEVELGRTPSHRWGPRVIDLDLLTYGDEEINEPDLQIPHARLFERAFALIPLAEIDRRFENAAQSLAEDQRGGVTALDGEGVPPMSDDALIERVRTLVNAFLETDLTVLRIEERNEDSIEIRRHVPAANGPVMQSAAKESVAAGVAPRNVDTIKADLVGVFHSGRPVPKEGDVLSADRELGYIEALGIRTPVRSFGPGKITALRCADGQPVEYGQVLFEIERP